MRKVLFSWIVLLWLTPLMHSRAQTGIITTIAGTGVNGFNGDTAVASACEFDFPGGITIDASGNIYIADENNYRIRKIDGSGNICTIGGGNSLFLSDPKGIVLDNSGHVIVADRGAQKVKRVDIATGNITTVVGTGAATFGGDGLTGLFAKLNDPSGVAIDESGNIYIADAQNNRVRKVDNATGIVSTIAGGGTSGYSGDNGPATAALLNFPTGVTADGGGNVYIADNNNHVIRRVNSTGIITTFAGNGNAGYNGDGIAATAAGLYNPNSVASDVFGNVYIADQNNHRIRKVYVATGIITTVAGNGLGGYSGDGGSAGSAQLYFPSAVTVSASGDLYIADENNNRIRKVTVPERVNTLNDDDIIVYPDPAINTVTIKNITGDQALCTMTNALGATVLQRRLRSSATDIDVYNLTAGLYYLRIETAKGIFFKKVVKM